MNHKQKFESITTGADIYGNFGVLDDQEEMPFIEIRYHCHNCHGNMFKKVKPSEASNRSIKCIYCQLTVNPLQLH